MKLNRFDPAARAALPPEHQCTQCKQWFVDPPQTHQCGSVEEAAPWCIVHVPTEQKEAADAKAHRDRDLLRDALQRIVNSYDAPHEFNRIDAIIRARKALEDTQP